MAYLHSQGPLVSGSWLETGGNKPSNSGWSQEYGYHRMTRSTERGTRLTLPGGTVFLAATNWDRASSSLEMVTAESTQFYKTIDGKQVLRTNVSTPGGGAIGNTRYLNVYWDDGVITQYVPDPLSVNSDGRNEAVTEALNRIANQKANLGENLATLGQTVQLLRRPVETLTESLMHAYRDRRFRSFLNRSFRSIREDGPLTWAARRYLELVYGWKPLMSDIYGLIELAKDCNVDLLLNAKGSAQRRYTAGPSTVKSSGHFTKVDGGYKDLTVRCKLWARIDPEWGGSRTLNQLGLLNPVSLAWDLMPWSFVVDWFVPIGPVLSAMSAPAGLVFVDGSVSQRERRVVSISEYRNLTKVTAQGYGTRIMKQDLYRRERQSSWPRPGFYFDSNPLRGDRWLKASALAISGLSQGRSTIR